MKTIFAVNILWFFTLVLIFFLSNRQAQTFGVRSRTAVVPSAPEARQAERPATALGEQRLPRKSSHGIPGDYAAIPRSYLEKVGLMERSYSVPLPPEACESLGISESAQLEIKELTEEWDDLILKELAGRARIAAEGGGEQFVLFNIKGNPYESEVLEERMRKRLRQVLSTEIEEVFIEIFKSRYYDFGRQSMEFLANSEQVNGDAEMIQLYRHGAGNGELLRDRRISKTDYYSLFQK